MVQIYLVIINNRLFLLVYISLLHSGMDDTNFPIEQVIAFAGTKEKPSLHTIRLSLPGRWYLYNLAVALTPGELVIISVSHLSARQVQL